MNSNMHRCARQTVASPSGWMVVVVTADGVVRGLGDTRTPLYASLVAEYAVFLPVARLLCRELGYGLPGLFWAHHLYWAACCLVAVMRVVRAWPRTAPVPVVPSGGVGTA